MSGPGGACAGSVGVAIPVSGLMSSSKPMVHLAQTMHLSYTDTNTDEDINTDTGMATPTEPAQVPPGPITRARARELNFVMILKNEGPEVS